MSETFSNLIRDEVRSILSTIEDLETIKFRTVIRILEGRLNFSKGGLNNHKDIIKGIIKEEAKLEYERRDSQKEDKQQSEEALAYEMEAYNAAQNDGLDIEPKRCSSAYLLFCNEKRIQLKTMYPDMSSSDILREAGNSWRELSPEEKKRYVDLSDLDHSRYGRELDEMRQKQMNYKRRGNDSRYRDEIAPVIRPAQQRFPKKARSAYIYYCLKHRSRIQEANDSITPMDVSRRLGEEWNHLTPEEKEPYKQEELKDRERYARELKALGLTVEGLRKSNRYSSLSASKAKSAYLYFCSLKREEIRVQNPQFSTNDLNKMLSEIWARMSDEEKLPYEENAFDDKERIKREVEKVKRSIKEPVVLPAPKAKRMKRARTPYTLFYKEQMAQLREQNESLPFGEISKKLADTWKSLSEEQKRHYVELSKLEQESTMASSSEDQSLRMAYDNFYKQRYADLQDKSTSKESIDSMINREWASMDSNSRYEYYRKYIGEKEPKNGMLDGAQDIMLIGRHDSTQNDDHYSNAN